MKMIPHRKLRTVRTKKTHRAVISRRLHINMCSIHSVNFSLTWLQWSTWLITGFRLKACTRFSASLALTSHSTLSTCAGVSLAMTLILGAGNQLNMAALSTLQARALKDCKSDSQVGAWNMARILTTYHFIFHLNRSHLMIRLLNTALKPQ